MCFFRDSIDNDVVFMKRDINLLHSLWEEGSDNHYEPIIESFGLDLP